MTGYKETQCTNCIHKEVCALKNDFLEACASISGLSYTRNEDGGIVRFCDVPFIYPVELKCKYFYQVTATARIADSCTAHDRAIPNTYTELRG